MSRKGIDGIDNDDIGAVNIYRGYYLEDCDCSLCLFNQSRKKGCKLDKCCCEEEKLEAVANGRIKRKWSV